MLTLFTFGAGLALAGVALAAPMTTLVSVKSAGGDSGNGHSYSPVLGSDGKLVLFWSEATNLTAENDANDVQDLFVRDVKTGTTTLVTVTANGAATSDMTAYGTAALGRGHRFVAFANNATNQVANINDTNSAVDLFRRDLKKRTTALVSINAAGTGPGNSGGNIPALAGGARFFAFESSASNLVANDTNGKRDVFVRDMDKGTTTLATVNAAGTNGGDGDSHYPSLGKSGKLVAFESTATDLVANDTNGKRDVFVRDVDGGTTTLASINAAGTTGGNDDSSIPFLPSLSRDGKHVLFRSRASDLVANDTNGKLDVFVRDLQAGTTALVSINAAGTDSGNSGADTIALLNRDDGHQVLFGSSSSNLVATNDTNGSDDVFLRDLRTGKTTLVSINAAGTATGNGQSRCGGLSRSGRYVAFTSGATDLVANDTNGKWDGFVRDLKTGTTTLASINAAGTGPANGDTFISRMGADGKTVVFESEATDLVATDTNGQVDVFVRRLQ